MTKREWPRLRGYKTYKKGSTKTDAGKVEWRLYIRTSTDPYSERKLFRAVCPEHDIDISGDEPVQLTKDLIETIEGKISVEWVPYLYVIVEPSRKLEPTKEGREPKSFFEPGGGYRDHTHAMGFEIKVSEIQLSDHEGVKRWREPSGSSYGRSDWHISEGWPEIGDKAPNKRGFYSYDDYKMMALVEDTPENRQAFENLRYGMQQMVRKLELLLSPDNIEGALLAALTGTNPLALPSGEKKAPKKKTKRKPRKVKNG